MADSSNAQIGSQTTLSYWDIANSPTNGYTPIANIRQFGEVGADRPEVDSTDLDSLAVQRIGGLKDGKEITIACVANATTVPLIEGLFDANEDVQLKAVFPAPLSLNRYFSLAPLGFTLGTITPSGLVEITLRGRISGDISSDNPHTSSPE